MGPRRASPFGSFREKNNMTTTSRYSRELSSASARIMKIGLKMRVHECSIAERPLLVLFGKRTI
jgi:hypothetical protein